MPNKSIYLIGSLRNKDIPIVAKELRDSGYDVFDDWYAVGPEADDHWRTYSQGKGQSYAEALEDYAAKHIFEFDKSHIDRCDASVLVFPAGRSAGIEFGYTIGNGKPAWVLLDDPDRWDVMVQFGTGWAFDIGGLLVQMEEYYA